MRKAYFHGSERISNLDYSSESISTWKGIDDKIYPKCFATNSSSPSSGVRSVIDGTSEEISTECSSPDEELLCSLASNIKRNNRKTKGRTINLEKENFPLKYKFNNTNQSSINSSFKNKVKNQTLNEFNESTQELSDSLTTVSHISSYLKSVKSGICEEGKVNRKNLKIKSSSGKKIDISISTNTSSKKLIILSNDECDSSELTSNVLGVKEEELPACERTLKNSRTEKYSYSINSGRSSKNNNVKKPVSSVSEILSSFSSSQNSSSLTNVTFKSKSKSKQKSLHSESISCIKGSEPLCPSKRSTASKNSHKSDNSKFLQSQPSTKNFSIKDSTINEKYLARLTGENVLSCDDPIEETHSTSSWITFQSNSNSDFNNEKMIFKKEINSTSGVSMPETNHSDLSSSEVDHSINSKMNKRSTNTCKSRSSRRPFRNMSKPTVIPFQVKNVDDEQLNKKIKTSELSDEFTNLGANCHLNQEENSYHASSSPGSELSVPAHTFSHKNQKQGVNVLKNIEDPKILNRVAEYEDIDEFIYEDTNLPVTKSEKNDNNNRQEGNSLLTPINNHNNDINIHMNLYQMTNGQRPLPILISDSDGSGNKSQSCSEDGDGNTSELMSSQLEYMISLIKPLPDNSKTGTTSKKRFTSKTSDSDHRDTAGFSDSDKNEVQIEQTFIPESPSSGESNTFSNSFYEAISSLQGSTPNYIYTAQIVTNKNEFKSTENDVFREKFKSKQVAPVGETRFSSFLLESPLNNLNSSYLGRKDTSLRGNFIRENKNQGRRSPISHVEYERKKRKPSKDLKKRFSSLDYVRLNLYFLKNRSVIHSLRKTDEIEEIDTKQSRKIKEALKCKFHLSHEGYNTLQNLLEKGIAKLPDRITTTMDLKPEEHTHFEGVLFLKILCTLSHFRKYYKKVKKRQMLEPILKSLMLTLIKTFQSNYKKIMKARCKKKALIKKLEDLYVEQIPEHTLACNKKKFKTRDIYKGMRRKGNEQFTSRNIEEISPACNGALQRDGHVKSKNIEERSPACNGALQRDAHVKSKNIEERSPAYNGVLQRDGHVKSKNIEERSPAYNGALQRDGHVKKKEVKDCDTPIKKIDKGYKSDGKLKKLAHIIKETLQMVLDIKRKAKLMKKTGKVAKKDYMSFYKIPDKSPKKHKKTRRSRILTYSYLDQSRLPHKIKISERLARTPISNIESKAWSSFENKDGHKATKYDIILYRKLENIRIGNIYSSMNRYEYPYRGHYLFNANGEVLRATSVLKNTICCIIIITKYPLWDSPDIKKFDTLYSNVKHKIGGKCEVITLSLDDDEVEWMLSMLYRPGNGIWWYLNFKSSLKWYFLMKYTGITLPAIFAIDHYGYRTSLDVIGDLEAYGHSAIHKWVRTSNMLLPTPILANFDELDWNTTENYEINPEDLEIGRPYYEEWKSIIEGKKKLGPQVITFS